VGGLRVGVSEPAPIDDLDGAAGRPSARSRRATAGEQAPR